MTKKIAVLALAMLLICAVTAQAAQWEEGLSPSRPYANVPEVNLNEQLGYMMFFPNAMAPAEHGCQTLFIYLPREDVKAGDGTFFLYAQEGDEVFSAPMSDPAVVTQREATEEELDSLLWGSGTCFEIVLPRSLQLGSSYFVNLENGAMVTESGVENFQVGDRDAWTFSVEGDYGVSAVAYAEGKVNFELTLGGDATQAVAYAFDDSVFFTETMFSESGTVTGTVNSDTPHWGVLFLDAQNNELNLVEFH